MPLLPGKKNIGHNIAEMEKAGHSRAQSIAAALNTARKALAAGGSTDKKIFSGFIKSSVPGRTDRLPVHVLSDSYVLPADIVSGLGEGNSLAGCKVIEHMFHGDGAFAKKIQARAAGGHVAHLAGKYGLAGHYHDRAVPVIVAGGEYILPPHVVEAIGDGDMDKGHAELDRFVKAQRAKLTKHLRSLPGPAKN